MRSTKSELNVVLKTDYLAFLEKAFHTLNPGKPFLYNWHLAAMAYQLERCMTGQTTRLMIHMPPRHLKSITVSIAFTAWLLGHDPGKRIIVISYADRLSKQFSRETRKIMEADWYQKLFPATRLSAKKNTETEIHTTKNGFRIATSVGGALTGFGGDYIILDDSMKAGDAKSEAERNSVKNWYVDTVPSRLDNPKAGVIMHIAQRTHVDDLCGYLMERGDWEKLVLPAIATLDYEEIHVSEGHTFERFRGDVLHPEHLPSEVLEERKRDIGSQNFEAQYQQDPVPPGGAMIQSAWFEWYTGRPKPGYFEVLTQSWDPAIETGEANDFSVCTTWGMRNNKHYVLGVFRGRLEFPTLVRTAVSLAHEWNPDRILIEKAGGGAQLAQTLYNLHGLPVITIAPLKDKVTRAAKPVAMIEARRVYLPREAPWLAELLRELLLFPYGKFDDQVDSVTQYLNYVFEKRRQSLEINVLKSGGGGSVRSRDHYAERTGRGVFDDLF